MNQDYSRVVAAVA